MKNPHITFRIDKYPTRTGSFPGNSKQTQKSNWGWIRIWQRGAPFPQTSQAGVTVQPSSGWALQFRDQAAQNAAVHQFSSNWAKGIWNSFQCFSLSSFPSLSPSSLPFVYSLLCLTSTRSASYEPVQSVKQLCRGWKLKMTAIISTLTGETVVIIVATESLQSLCYL